MKHINLGFRNYLSHFLNNPYFDWALVMLVGIITGALGIIGAVTLFLNIQSGAALANPSVPPASASMSAINQVGITELTRSLDEKKAREAAIRQSSYTKVADPAL